MLKTEDLNQASDLIDSFRPDVGFFERKMLVPEVRGRIEYIVEIFESFKELCDKNDIAKHIDAALREIANPNKLDVSLPEPQVGGAYLNSVKEQCDREYINPAKKLLEDNPSKEVLKDIESITAFLNAASFFFQSLIGVKDKVFHYSLRTFANIKNTSSGEVLLGPPIAITLILMPFETRIAELVSVSETTVESISRWSEQIRDQKKKRIDIIAHLSQVKAAEQQAKAAKYNMLFQVAVIVFTVVLVLGTQKAQLFLENRELSEAIGVIEERQKACSSGLESYHDEINALKTEIDGLRSKLEEPIKRESTN